MASSRDWALCVGYFCRALGLIQPRLKESKISGIVVKIKNNFEISVQLARNTILKYYKISCSIVILQRFALSKHKRIMQKVENLNCIFFIERDKKKLYVYFTTHRFFVVWRFQRKQQ